MNVTVPVGVGVPDVGATVAVKVTLAPTATEVAGAVSAVVVGVGTGATPVPVKVATSGLSGALSAKVRVADSPLVVLGANSTLTVQVFPADTVALEQASVPMMKSAMLVPPGVTVVIVRLVVPVFVMVRVFALLVVPSVWFPKASGLGEAENRGPLTGPLITVTLLLNASATYNVFVVEFNAAATGPVVLESDKVVSVLVAPLMTPTLLVSRLGT